jgi:hypothetical protein
MNWVIGGNRRWVGKGRQALGADAHGTSMEAIMNFVLVNGRTPRPQAFCALCCEPIAESYLREIATRLSYCDHKCYCGHWRWTIEALQRPAKALKFG